MIKTTVGNIKRLQINQLAWANAKVGLMVWGILYFFFPPDGPVEELGPFLNEVIGVFAIFGAMVSIIGLIMSADIRVKFKSLGLAIELFGLSMAVLAPLSFLIVQLAIADGDGVRFTLCAFAYGYTMAFVARGVTINRALHKGG